MFAKNLEALLSELCEKADVSPGRQKDIAARFDALRGCSLLPRGRKNREKILTVNQIAAAIFGLAPSESGWAGHAGIILSNLRPVGGPDASFLGSVNLLQAIEFLLSDSNARSRVIGLSISLAEMAINSHGIATLSYVIDGVRRQANYVRKEAVSLLRPGAEREFDAEERRSPASKETKLSRAFFDRIAMEMERAKAFPALPEGDGSEYDAEEEKAERYRKLGVQADSRFLNIGVDNQVAWPRHETLAKFDRYHFVLMPKTRDDVQSVHVDLTLNRLSDREAMTVVNRFLSVMTWCDDQYAVAQGGWSGNPVPVPVPKRNLAFTTTYDWVFDRQIPSSDEARRALGLYREARNAQQNFLVSFAVLNYYKIIEIRHPKIEATKWIGRVFPIIREDKIHSGIFDLFLKECGDESPEKYIYLACRVAVAHASPEHPSDPDDTQEIARLHVAADVMRLLARHLIATELRVSDSIYSGE